MITLLLLIIALLTASMVVCIRDRDFDGVAISLMIIMVFGMITAAVYCLSFGDIKTTIIKETKEYSPSIALCDEDRKKADFLLKYGGTPVYIEYEDTTINCSPNFYSFPFKRHKLKRTYWRLKK